MTTSRPRKGVLTNSRPQHGGQLCVFLPVLPLSFQCRDILVDWLTSLRPLALRGPNPPFAANYCCALTTFCTKAPDTDPAS